MLKIHWVNDTSIRISGRFDASQVNTAEQVLDEVERSFELDCQELEYISSAGIGVLLGTFKRLHETGENFRMVNVKPQIRQVFRYSGLDKVFQIEGA
jgi:anti-anti-sigma factor